MICASNPLISSLFMHKTPQVECFIPLCVCVCLRFVMSEHFPMRPLATRKFVKLVVYYVVTWDMTSTMSGKEQPTRKRRVFGDGSFQVATTVIFCLCMTVFVFILGTFINNHARNIILSDDLYSPHFTSSKFCLLSISSAHSLCNSSSPSSPPLTLPLNISSGNVEFTDFLYPKNVWHSMNDEELMWRASMVPRLVEYPCNRTPKVAFMFLTRGRLPLAPLWEKFFKGHEGFFSIYIHTSPEFTYEPSNSSVFYKRRVPSQLVQWGRASMIDAERRLLANALLDFSNERFVLLSESCIPIFNFTTIYNYLINSNQSYLSSFDDPRKIGRGRYSKRMWPTITLPDWRKGSQWFEVNRRLAIEIISDTKYYRVLKDHCTPPCYMDEHYLPTLVNIVCPELTSNRTITWTDWSTGGSHPATFVRKDVSQAFLDRVRYGSNCSYNGEMSSVCFLFARKFNPGTLEPLMKIAPRLLGFN